MKKGILNTYIVEKSKVTDSFLIDVIVTWLSPNNDKIFTRLVFPTVCSKVMVVSLIYKKEYRQFNIKFTGVFCFTPGSIVSTLKQVWWQNRKGLLSCIIWFVLACCTNTGYSLANWSAFEMQYAALGLLLFPFHSMASACVYALFVGKYKTSEVWWF